MTVVYPVAPWHCLTIVALWQWVRECTSRCLVELRVRVCSCGRVAGPGLAALGVRVWLMWVLLFGCRQWVGCVTLWALWQWVWRHLSLAMAFYIACFGPVFAIFSCVFSAKALDVTQIFYSYFCIEILSRVTVNLRLHWVREAHTHKNPVPSGRHP